MLDFKMHVSQARQGRRETYSRDRAAGATRHFPKYRCLRRQRDAYFHTSPLVQHNWDPRPDTIRYRIAPDLLCTRFYPRMH